MAKQHRRSRPHVPGLCAAILLILVATYGSADDVPPPMDVPAGQGSPAETMRARPRDRSCYLEARSLLRGDAAEAWTVVDVRDTAAFERAHIPGSLNMQIFAVKSATFLQDNSVLLVDEGWSALATEDTCRQLRSRGWNHLAILYGGLHQWARAGGALEGPGSGTEDLSVMPPSALHAARQADDFVMIDPEMADAPRVQSVLPDCLELPMAPGESNYVAKVETALQGRPRPCTVVLVTQNGKGCGQAAVALGRLDDCVFILQGGADAYRQFIALEDAVRPDANKQQVAGRSSATRPAPSTAVRPCSSCPGLR